MANTTGTADRGPMSDTPVRERLSAPPPKKAPSSDADTPEVFTKALAEAFFGEGRLDAVKTSAPSSASPKGSPKASDARTVEPPPLVSSNAAPKKPAETDKNGRNDGLQRSIDDQGLRRVAVHVGLPVEHVRAVALGAEVEPTDVPLVVPERINIATAAKVIRRDRRVLRQWCVDHPDLAPIPTGKSLPRWVWDDAESVIAFRDAVRERERVASLPPSESPVKKAPRRSRARPEVDVGKGVTKADLVDRLLSKKKR